MKGLGFGCSSLLGPKSRGEGLELLGAAFDSGIRHFDVARLYGYGDAEGLLGEFLQSKRNEVTITTKFGIQPNKKVARYRGLVGLARGLMKVSPHLRSFIRSKKEAMIQRGVFSVDEARKQLEVSLKELKTDHIDFYLLHDCIAQDCESHELLQFLDLSVRQGKILQFGVGTKIDEIEKVTVQEFTKVLQFENNILKRNIEQLPNLEGQMIFTHSPLGESFKKIKDFLDKSSSARKSWSDQLEIPSMDSDTLSALMLQYALHANPRGVVLFSSTHRDTIKKNARVAFDGKINPSQIQKFINLASKI